MKRLKSHISKKKLPVIGFGVILAVMLLQFLFSLLPFSIPNPADMPKYLSPDISILYPRGWLVEEPTPNDNRWSDGYLVVSFHYLKSPFSQVSVIIYRSVASYDSLTQVVQWGEQKIQTAQGYEAISINPVSFHGEDMVLREYILHPAWSLLPSRPARCLTNYRFHNHTGFMIRFCAVNDDYAQFRPLFMNMIGSLIYLQ
jgi:hypothetical protein